MTHVTSGQDQSAYIFDSSLFEPRYAMRLLTLYFSPDIPIQDGEKRQCFIRTTQTEYERAVCMHTRVLQYRKLDFRRHFRQSSGLILMYSVRSHLKRVLGGIIYVPPHRLSH